MLVLLSNEGSTTAEVSLFSTVIELLLLTSVKRAPNEVPTSYTVDDVVEVVERVDDPAVKDEDDEELLDVADEDKELVWAKGLNNRILMHSFIKKYLSNPVF